MMSYNNEEARFVRQPVSMLCNYLESPYFREQRDKKQMRQLKKGSKAVNKHKGTLRLPLDLSQIKALFGQTAFNEEIDDFERFFMQNDGQTMKIAQLSQCRIEGQAVPPSMDLSVESSFIHMENQELLRNASNNFNPEQTVR